jgi:hypothetical protein
MEGVGVVRVALGEDRGGVVDAGLGQAVGGDPALGAVRAARVRGRGLDHRDDGHAEDDRHGQRDDEREAVFLSGQTP